MCLLLLAGLCTGAAVGPVHLAWPGREDGHGGAEEGEGEGGWLAPRRGLGRGRQAGRQAGWLVGAKGRRDGAGGSNFPWPAPCRSACNCPPAP